MPVGARIGRLQASDAAAYRALMLQAYECEPDAFTTTAAERQEAPLAWWAARAGEGDDPRECVFGAWIDGRLVGLAGLARETRTRTRHKATLFGMYVEPGARGQGLARGLVGAVLDHARHAAGLCVVQLTVTESNVAAVALYRACGFEPFGVEPMAVRVGDRFVRKVHMACELPKSEAMR